MCRKLFLLPLLFALSSPGCKREEKMPPQTRAGQEILACKVNGEIHTYRGKGTRLYPSGVKCNRAVNGTDSFTEIRAISTKIYNDDIWIAVRSFDIEVDRPYILSSGLEDNIAVYRSDATYSTGLNSGVVTFTRYDEKIASGVFSLTAITGAGGKVEITEGFFDIKR